MKNRDLVLVMSYLAMLYAPLETLTRSAGSGVSSSFTQGSIPISLASRASRMVSSALRFVCAGHSASEPAVRDTLRAELARLTRALQ